jgi:hypothetical protein
MGTNGSQRNVRRAAGVGRVAALLVMTNTLLGGCHSPAIQAFERVRLGDAWDAVSGAEAFAKDGPHAYGFTEYGPKQRWATSYIVITAEGGAVAAKAICHAGADLRRALLIGPQALQELLCVEESYPFPTEPVTTLPSGIRVERWVYRPLANPGSAPDDPVLASGVRASTWAYLASCFDGWPIAQKVRKRASEEIHIQER